MEDKSYDNSLAWEILDNWLSQILSLDFDRDIYENIEVVKKNIVPSVKDRLSKKHGSWFIGDILKDQLVKLYLENKTSKRDIESVERRILKIWKDFKREQCAY